MHGLTNVKICHDCMLRDQLKTVFSMSTLSLQDIPLLVGFFAQFRRAPGCLAPPLGRNCYAENLTTTPWHIWTDIFMGATSYLHFLCLQFQRYISHHESHTFRSAVLIMCTDANTHTHTHTYSLHSLVRSLRIDNTPTSNSEHTALGSRGQSLLRDIPPTLKEYRNMLWNTFELFLPFRYEFVCSWYLLLTKEQGTPPAHRKG